MSNTLQNGTILVGDDDPDTCNYLEMALRCRGYSVELARNGDEVLSSLKCSGAPISALLLDIVMPIKGGLDTLREIRDLSLDVPVVMISGDFSPATVAASQKLGAIDFLYKPLKHADLNAAVTRALESKRAPSAAAATRAANRQSLLGSDPRMRHLEAMIGRVASSDAPVLIQGETGVGKEVIARELHRRSPRRDMPFLKLNCAALPPELVESELFGYERGAFTGAFQRKPGMFELADRGTLLLDEIGDMDLRLQAKLLQVLQDHEFQRVGGREVVRVDVRIVAATHRDLEERVQHQAFREDLYYRLNVIGFVIPPLRERRDDIVPLAEFLLHRHTAPGFVMPVLSAEFKKLLSAYRWPGNVRELENMMRKLLILADPDLVAREIQEKTARIALNMPALKQTQNGTSGNRSDGEPTSVLDRVAKAKQESEAEAILAVLEATCWNRKRAAALLDIDYKALLYKIKKLGLEERSNPPAQSECAVV